MYLACCAIATCKGESISHFVRVVTLGAGEACREGEVVAIVILLFTVFTVRCMSEAICFRMLAQLTQHARPIFAAWENVRIQQKKHN
jgi:hypothetical protein